MGCVALVADIRTGDQFLQHPKRLLSNATSSAGAATEKLSELKSTHLKLASSLSIAHFSCRRYRLRPASHMDGNVSYVELRIDLVVFAWDGAE